MADRLVVWRIARPRESATRVGAVEQAGDGTLSFAYDDDDAGAAISVSLPRGTERAGAQFFTRYALGSRLRGAV